MTSELIAEDRTESACATRRLAALIPGGAHTYAKAADQFPVGLAPVITRGQGAHVWDVDGHEYIEYGSGLRSVVLGHAHPKVLDAVRDALLLGSNFARPSVIELQAASRLTACLGAEMIKFAKNGSDATTAAIKLARAVTGRSLVAICADQPFFSTDDWFIGTTPMAAGIPAGVSALTVRFPYGDLAAAEQLFAAHPGEIACFILEPAASQEPPDGYLAGLLQLVHKHGALLIFDEMITGFRWSEHGAQHLYGVQPDLSTWGKAMGNGFAVAALTGPAELMNAGGLDPAGRRVFLLSTTHGAETHALAAAMSVVDVFENEGVAQRLMQLGSRLAAGVRAEAAAAGVAEHLLVRGRDCNLVFATLDDAGSPSQEFRTLFMRQLILGGVLGTSFVVSNALTDADIDKTIEVVGEACIVYRKALEYGDATPWTGGRPTRPVMRS